MIGIIVVMIVSVIVMYNQHKNYMMDKKRIKELEDRLTEYYNKRENRLIKKFKDIEQQ
jgi:hypothetical protein